MDEQYDNPQYSPSRGRWVNYGGDSGGQWEEMSVGSPLGYWINQGDSDGSYVEYSPEERRAISAQQEADRQGRLQQASAFLATNPLAISGDMIATPYGERNISSFKPILQPGESVTGSTRTQLLDPTTGTPIFLNDPNDPYSYTTSPTDTPALGGTVEQQAALYRPIQNKGVFGTLGSDLLEAVKDPYFRNFAIAAASMGAAAALAPAAGAAAPAAGAGSSTAGGFLGGAGEILPGAVGTGGGSLGATGVVGSTAGGFLGGAGEIMPGAVGTGGGSLGGSSLGSTLKGALDVAKMANRARSAVNLVSSLGQSSSALPTVAAATAAPAVYGALTAGQTAPTSFMSSYESPAEVEARNLKFGKQASQFPELNNVSPQLKNLLYARLGNEANQFNSDPLGALDRGETLIMRDGGTVMNEEGEPHIPEFITGKTGHYVKGKGDGQADLVPAMLASGEFVWDADTVAALGNGDSDSGAKILDAMRMAIREHKRSAPVDKIPPKAKSPLQYMKDAEKYIQRDK